MNWFWKRRDSGPDRTLGPDGEEVVWFHHRPPPPYLAATLKDHKQVSAPTLNDNELASAEALADTELASAETLNENELAFADTLTDSELTSAEMLHEDEISSEETLTDDELTSTETVHEDEIASAEMLHEGEISSEETLTDDELASAETAHEDELALADTITDSEPASAEMLPDNELASADQLNDNQRVSAPALSEHKRASIRNWGMAAAVASGLGLVLLSWPVWDGQTSTDGRTARVTTHAGQASGARPGYGAAASGPGEQRAPPGDSPVAADAPGRPFELQRARDARTTQNVGELATRATANAQPHVDTTPTGRTAAAAGASSAPVEAAEAPTITPAPTSPAARVPAIATAPPPRPRIAPAIIGATSGAGSSASLIRRPARWLGGGPSDADNWGGRYQGTVAVKVTVGPSGRVSNCVPVRRSGNVGLDAMTCRLVQERARFNPALNAQGRPVVSQAYTTFVWGRRRRY